MFFGESYGITQINFSMKLIYFYPSSNLSLEHKMGRYDLRPIVPIEIENCQDLTILDILK